MNTQAVLPRHFGEASMEEDPIPIAAKDRLSIVATQNRVRRNTGEIEAGESGHAVITNDGWNR
jgi:hypothetical protein